jgi:hypothetical protein
VIVMVVLFVGILARSEQEQRRKERLEEAEARRNERLEEAEARPNVGGAAGA